MKRFWKISLVVLLMIPVGFGTWYISPTNQFPDEIDDMVLFRQGEEGYHTFRIPGFIQLPNNTLLAFCEGRQNSMSDFGNIDLIMKRSVDNGELWSDLYVLWDAEGLSLSNPCPVYDSVTNTVFVHIILDRADHYVLNSTDFGKTWSPPVLVNTGKADWAFQGPSPGHGIQLESGRLLIPGMYNTVENADNNAQWGSYYFYSDDHGLTWERGHDFGVGTNEFTACQLENGSILAFLRTNREGSDINHKQVSLSNDGGNTSSTKAFDNALTTPICMSGCLSLPNNIVIFSNPANTKARKDFTLWVSKNGGENWAVKKKIYSYPAAYSDLVQLDETTVGCLVECGKLLYQERIMFLRIPLDYLVG